MLNASFTLLLSLAGILWAVSLSPHRWATLLAGAVGLLCAFMVLPYAFHAVGFSASSMVLPWRILRAFLTLLGADPVSARHNEALGNTGAALADLWTIPSLLGAPVAALIHARWSR